MKLVQVATDRLYVLKVLIDYSFCKYVPGNLFHTGVAMLYTEGHFLINPLAH